MKTNRFTILAFLLIGTMLLAACGGAAKPAAATTEKVKVVYVIGGTLGDKSFVDSANRGFTQSVKDFGIEYVPVEATSDPAKIKAAFNDAVADPTVKIIFHSQGELLETVGEICDKNPKKQFVIFDQPFDFDKYPACKANVYAMQYKQNEGSFLAGYYAGLMSKSKIIGAVGGMDIPVINDFMVGYVQGAGEAGVTKNNVLIQYAASWSDPAKGKELALTEYQQGADVVFQVAGGTGEGVFYAAQEAKKWAIGVDSDQHNIIAETNPEQAKVILTSMLKNVDKSVVRFFKMYTEGKVPWGTNEKLGIPEQGVGLAMNDYFNQVTPQDVKDKLAAIQQKVVSGEIKVASVY